MTPHYTDPWLTVYAGDCRDVLPTLAAESVDCVVTSPPYWGLRDYGSDGQLGLEPTPEEYVANLVAVFREVRRVLKASGTCWLNLGDSYASSPPGNTTKGVSGASTLHGVNGASGQYRDTLSQSVQSKRNTVVGGLKPKDLVGIPWRVAFALQADGWYLRSDIIWAKPNPMPESVTDRPTKAHEYLFLLTKSARYYFDADAVREVAVRPGDVQTFGGAKARNGEPIPESDPRFRNGKEQWGRTIESGINGRNLRSVWTIATRPYADAHFAVFPPELPERCIKAGSSEKGVCSECGAPWERVVEHERLAPAPPSGMREIGRWSQHQESDVGGRTRTETTGWRPTCRCEKDGGGWVPEPAVILDPFAGSGTVGLVANRLSRRAILVDLNPDYMRQQMKRNAQTPLGLGS